MANSFPGSGLAYADQFAVGRSSGTGLLNTFLSNDLSTIQIRAESDTSSVLTYLGISAGTMEYYRGANTSGTLNFKTKVQAASSANAGGAIVFSPNGTASDYTPVERMRILMNGNVGIGTDVPSYKLDIGGSGPSFGMSNTSATGYNEMYFSRNTSTVVGYIGVGVNAAVTANGDDFVIQNRLSTGNLVLHTNTTERMRITSAGNVGIGGTPTNFGAGYTVLAIDNAGAGGGAIDLMAATVRKMTIAVDSDGPKFETKVDGDPIKFKTNSGGTIAERVRITSSGSVGINTSTPGTYKLNVNGTFYSAGSSLEYKTDITTLDTDTNKILELRPVTYQYKDEYKHLGKELKSGTQIGLIAEEVAEVFPELAMMKEDEDGETRVRNVDYEKLSILLLSEVQKLRKEVNELKNK
jgi:hypothetical protein